MTILLALWALTATPSDSMTHFIDAREWTQAIRWIDRALESSPGDPYLRFRKAQILAWSGEYENAVRLLDVILKDTPGSSDAILLKARIRSWQGRYSEAESIYGGIPSTDPAYPDAKAGLAQVLYYRGDTARALAQAEAVLTTTPDNEIARLLATTIRQSLRPVSITTAQFTTDTDKNRVFGLGETVEWGIRPGLIASASARWFHTESLRSGQSRDVNVVSFTATGTRYRTGLGLTRFADGGSASPMFTLGYRNGTTDLYIVRYGLFDSPVLASKRIMMTEAGVVAVPWNRSFRIGTEASISHFSNGNQRYRWVADASSSQQAFGWTLNAGVRSHLQFFAKNTTAAGYFSPAWWNVTTVRVNGTRPVYSDRLRWDAGADFGFQRVKPFGTPASGIEPSYALRTALALAWNRLSVDTGVQYSTLLNTSPLATSNRYRSLSFNANVRYRF